jgi:hypothetical protein
MLVGMDAPRDMRTNPQRFARYAAAAISMKVDAVTVEITSVFESAGVPSILLKGPTVCRWLYEGDPCAYADSDLYIGTHYDEAASHLRRRGFERIRDDRPENVGRHSYPWVRASDGAEVDLHVNLPGLGSSSAVTWEVLQSLTEQIELAGVQLTGLGEVPRTMLVALHSAEHGATYAKAMDDLERAIVVVPFDVWERARGLAVELDGERAFATGLWMHPRGRELAEVLGLTSPDLVQVAALTGGLPTGALFVEKLARAPLRQKITLLARKVVPPAEVLRERSAAANRGPLGLAAARVVHVGSLVRAAPSVIAGWLREQHRRR